MKLKPYPEYKESGVEWLGKSPEHWEVRRLSYFFSERREKVSDKDYQALSVTKNGVVPQLENAAKTDDGDNRKLVLAGDFVINSRSDRKGSSGLSDLDGSVSLINTVLKPYSNIHGRFAHHLFRSYLFQEEYYKYGRGIVADLWSTNYSEMRNISLAVPSYDDQISIATFLNHETAKLDTLIAKQEKLIELLQEKRQAIISHAVTKGLDPNVKMKDSGVEWLGMVPDSWNVASIKRIISQPLMYGANEASDEAISENPRYVRITDIDVDGNLRNDTFRSLPEDIAKPYLLKDGDILLARSGGTVGKTFIYRDTWGICCFAGYLIKASVEEGIMDADFLYACLQSSFYWQYIYSEQIQATIQNVSAERYGNFKIPVPTVNEQLKIVTFLNQQTNKIDNLIDKAKRSIELAKEHRTALISAAVTGKIDVREYAQ